jgi:hypothetical protein
MFRGLDRDQLNILCGGPSPSDSPDLFLSFHRCAYEITMHAPPRAATATTACPPARWDCHHVMPSEYTLAATQAFCCSSHHLASHETMNYCQLPCIQLYLCEYQDNHSAAASVWTAFRASANHTSWKDFLQPRCIAIDMSEHYPGGQSDSKDLYLKLNLAGVTFGHGARSFSMRHLVQLQEPFRRSESTVVRLVKTDENG